MLKIRSGSAFLAFALLVYLGFFIMGNDEYRSETYSQVTHWDQQKKFILGDQQDEIDDAYKVEPELYDRVAFWFDIYTRYDNHHKVIHHNLYPWIVYEVVDTRELSEPKKYMKLKMKWYRLVLENLKSKKTGFTKEEKRLYGLLLQAPDPLRALITADKKVRYQSGQRDSIEKGLQRSTPFIDHMEEIFAQHGLPTELVRLPLVESSFDTSAYSRVGAAGVWQFMPRTGRKFMRVGRRFDERISPLKATEAAAKLLKQNYKILKGEWPLAVTAYNHGPTGIRRAVKKVGSESLADIIKDYRDDRFSFASANFYPCFLAILHAEKYRRYVFPDIPRKPSPAIAKMKVDGKMRAKKLLATYRVSKEDFLLFNPDLKKALRRNYRLPRGMKYFIPLKSSGTLAVSEDPRTDIARD